MGFFSRSVAVKFSDRDLTVEDLEELLFGAHGDSVLHNAESLQKVDAAEETHLPELPQGVEKDTEEPLALTLKQGITAPARFSLLEVGVADIVRLFNSLPGRGNKTELRAILKTFHTFGLDLDALVAEVARKEELTLDRIKVLQEDIVELDNSLKLNKEELEILELGHKEIQKLNTAIGKMLVLENDIGIEADASVKSARTPAKRKSTKPAAKKRKQANSRQTSRTNKARKVDKPLDQQSNSETSSGGVVKKLLNSKRKTVDVA